MEMLVRLPSTEVQEKTGHRILEFKGEDWKQWEPSNVETRDLQRNQHIPC